MQRQARPPRKHQPMYGWALTPSGKPVPISAAKRGQRYFCPVCRGEVIPRLGEVKQHHFSHVSLVDCTPENVARAVAGVWLADALNQKLISHEPVNITWQTHDGTTSHTVNILKDIDFIATKRQNEQAQGDLVLLNRERKAKVVILLGIDPPPPPEKLAAWTQSGIAVLMLNPVGVRSGQMNLVQLLESSTVLGGWWLLDKTAMPSDLIMEPALMRKTLLEAVFRPPHSFFGELHDEGSMSHVLDIAGKKLWLPPSLWQDVVGGSQNRLSPDVDVIIQEWEQEDSSRIALFYITVNRSSAVAIRRYPPGEQVVIRLDTAAFRLGRTTALKLAGELAGPRIELPR